MLCVECEEREASRHCEQCEDNYCDVCFDEKHASGKRTHHTFKSMGPVRCMECEKCKATRWCIECDDPYCLGCFQIIHAKGKKANHEFSRMGHGRENTQTYDEYLETEDYHYMNNILEDEQGVYEEEQGVYEEEQGVYAEEGAYAEEEGFGEEWETNVDDISGLTYYYNTLTGETQWA